MRGQRTAGATMIAFLLVGSASIAHANPVDLIGGVAPRVHARALESDEAVELADYRGQVVVLAFVATWCRACRRAVPQLEALEAAHPGVTVLALSYEDRTTIREHLAREPRRYRTVQCTGHTAVSYGADALPTLLVVDREGRIAAAYQGASAEIFASLDAEVRRLLPPAPAP